MPVAAARTLTILRLLTASEEPLTASQVAARAAIALASTYRLLDALIREGFVAVDDAGGYRATLRVLEPAVQLLGGRGIREVCFPHMVQLSRAVGCSISLGLLEAPYVVHVERVFCQAERVASRLIYQRRPLLQSPSGLIMAAFLPELEANSLLAETPEPVGEILRADSLPATLGEYRRAGYGAFDGLAWFGRASSALIVPVFDGAERPVAVLAVTRLIPLDDAFVVAARLPAVETAARISTELGSRGQQFI